MYPPFIVLDEPTAALDPMAEFEIYSKFYEIVGDKTVIYIAPFVLLPLLRRHRCIP